MYKKQTIHMYCYIYHFLERFPSLALSPCIGSKPDHIDRGPALTARLHEQS